MPKLDKDLTVGLYREISKSNKPRVMDHWHSSSLANCPRAQFLARKGVPPINTPEAGKILRWASGHVIEGRIREHLVKLYPDLVSNVRLTDDKQDITGESDNYVPSIKTIIEVKSVHDWAMAKNKETKEVELRGNEPYLSHQIQNHSYVKLSRDSGSPVEKIKYLYITLGGLMVAYETPVLKELLDNVKARLKVLNEAWATDTPPECICREDHPLWKSTMQYCDYKGEDECCSLKTLTKLNKE